MLYRGINAVCSEIHKKHINTLCGQKVELLNVELAVHKENLRLKRLKHTSLESHLDNDKEGKVRYAVH
jgi:hypothetical protein